MSHGHPEGLLSLRHAQDSMSGIEPRVPRLLGPFNVLPRTTGTSRASTGAVLHVAACAIVRNDGGQPAAGSTWRVFIQVVAQLNVVPMRGPWLRRGPLGY